MLRLFQWLFFGHVHKWQTVSENPLAMRDDAGKETAKGRRYIQQCERCGIVKKRDLI